jgi:hypothetical protein
MSTIKVGGHSDDIICVEGDTYEEFYPDDDKPGYLSFGDGTVLSVRYGNDGFWRINRLVEGMAEFTKVEATDLDEEYSDVATLTGDLKWLVFGSHFERIKAKGEGA